MNTFIKTIEVIGIITFAVTGIFEDGRRDDLVGVYWLRSAFGGGTLRDFI
jgi:uncharacterized membrane protein YeiH